MIVLVGLVWGPIQFLHDTFEFQPRNVRAYWQPAYKGLNAWKGVLGIGVNYHDLALIDSKALIVNGKS